MLKKLNLQKNPFTGITAFIIVLFVMPLGHTLMILIEYLFTNQYQFFAAFILGLLGFFLLILAIKKNNETPATWLGFFAGIFIWTGWVEFSFVYFAHHLEISPLIENGEVVTKPEYLILPSSIGLMFAIIPYFLFRSETRCHLFNWFQRLFKMDISPPEISRKRNFGIITSTETIFVLWFFYTLLMLVYDNRIFGEKHMATYFVFYGSLVWSSYLFYKLINIKKIAPAIRYAIPTVIIFWNSIEILGRWGFFEEIWVHPTTYVWEMIIIFITFIIFTTMSIINPKLTNSTKG
ncbi:MAG: hypothetical protein H8E85_02925 [Candidatus Marinimicrobia bacterium]|nr:hypothetical protein [Candidatus Neomarinimicrobiota bacterium]